MVTIEQWYEVQLKGECYVCPRCGMWEMDEKPTRNALSRRARIYICDRCGTEEAVEDMAAYSNKAYKKKELSEWAIHLPQLEEYFKYVQGKNTFRSDGEQ